MRYTELVIGSQVEIEDRRDGAWSGPYEVIDYGQRNDFMANGKIDVLYLQPPLTHSGPSFVDYPVKGSVFSRVATRRSDGLIAFTYPEAWCRLAR